jgi:hypothetical protein
MYFLNGKEPLLQEIPYKTENLQLRRKNEKAGKHIRHKPTVAIAPYDL